MREDPLRDLPSRLDATPAELLGLALLLAGVVAATAAVWWTSPAGPGRATAAPAATVTAGAAVPVGEVTVHVGGAVRTPGVVTLPDGARVTDALAAAGGATLEADTSRLNLARILQDGEQVLVPTPDDPSGEAAAATGGITADGRVDLNRATAGELETIPGVGPVLAARIVAWREEHGRFTEVGQLREVAGIGERTFQGMVDAVVVS